MKTTVHSCGLKTQARCPVQAERGLELATVQHVKELSLRKKWDHQPVLILDRV